MAHPLVERQSPSPEQLPAISDRGRDVVVTAGAGTGKTRTLVARYLSLLIEDGLPLRRIIAITFTRKAAREMRNRVREALRAGLDLPALTDEERDFLREAYSRLDAARIGTIHALCTEILRAHPAEAALDPRFELLDEAQTGLLKTRAIDEALAQATAEPDLAPLFTVLSETGLRDALADLLKTRLDAADSFARQPADLLIHWQTILVERQASALQALVARPDWRTAVEIVLTGRANKDDDLLEVQRRNAADALAGINDDVAATLIALSRLAALNLRGGAKGNWPGGEAEVKEMKAALTTLRDLWKADILLTLQLNPADETAADTLPRLKNLFNFASARYAQLKDERNALDFDDLEQGALALLQKNEPVRRYWQGECRAILTDEFQDTNARQRDLLNLLNGGEGKLFVVGDAKQSIYRFRGADVAVFRQERERIRQARGIVFPLDTSYRAHKALLLGMNDLLKPVLGESESPERPWAEPFAALKPHRLEPASGLAAPFIEIHLAAGVGNGRDRSLRAADILAARLVELAVGKHHKISNNQPITYGDMAILCRASTAFAAYEDALERAGVPYLTVAGRGFYHRPEIRDLLNALTALADPTDEAALAGLLRSPAIGLSDVALYHLRQTELPLWEALQRDPQFGPAVGLIETLHNRAGRTPAADLLKDFLDATGYPAALSRAGQKRSVRNVAKLLADAQTSGLTGVSEFLAYVDALRDSGAREGEARAVAEGAVQLMTIHAAKGLEFPVVAIGHVNHVSPAGNPLLLDSGLGVLLPLKMEDKDGTLAASYVMGKTRAGDQEAAEADRLLYVAVTRAEDVLLLSGNIEVNEKGTPSRLSGWLKQLAAPECLNLASETITCNPEGNTARRLTLKAGETPVACTVYEPEYRPVIGAQAASIPAGANAAAPYPVLTAPLIPPGQAQLPSDERVWRVVPSVERPTAPAWVVGQLVHLALAQWRFPDAPAFTAWISAQARGWGLLDDALIDNAAGRCRSLLNRFRAHPLYAQMIAAETCLHEVPYTLPAGNNSETGVMDALFRQNGTWTIVEFKTDRLNDEAARDQLLAQNDYPAQVARYRRAAQTLLGSEPQVMLCWLNLGGQVAAQVM